MVLRQSSLQLLRPVVEADIEGVLDLTDRNKNGNSNVSSFTRVLVVKEFPVASISATDCRRKRRFVW